MKLRTFLLLVLVTGLVAWGAYTTFESEQPLPKLGETVIPGLLESVNEARSIVITSGGEQFEVSASEGNWQVPSRSGYRADSEKLRELLLGAGELVYIEPKTSNKSLYERLGLDDPSKPKSSAIHVQVKAADGKLLADLTIGNRKPARGVPGEEEIYVLTAGDEQAWLVRGKLPYAASTVLDWLDREMLKVESDRILSVTVQHPDGYQLEVFKAKPGDADFTIRGLQDSEKIDDVWRVNDIGRLFMSMDLDDVLPATQAGDPVQPYLVTMKTFDGMHVDAQVWQQNERALANLSVRYDASLRDKLPRQESQSASGSADTQSEKSTLPAALLDVEAVQKEVSRISERLKGWTFELPDFKLEYIKRRKPDLLAKSEPAKAGVGPLIPGTSGGGDSSEPAGAAATGATQPASPQPGDAPAPSGGPAAPSSDGGG